MAQWQKLNFKKASLGTSSLLAGAAFTGVALSLAWRWSSGARDDAKSNAGGFPPKLDPNSFRRARLVRSDNVGAGAKLLKFRIEEGAGLAPLRPFTHVQLRGVTMDVPPEYPFGLRVERPYTPITATKHDFELLIKRYPQDTKTSGKAPSKGMTSRFLLSLQPGDRVEFKGPVATSEDEVLRDAVMSRKFVGMVCGGSGVTPMIQLLSRLTSADASRKFSLLWSNRSAEDMFFKKELEGIARSMRNVTLRYTLTRMAPPGWQHDTGRVSKDLLRARMPPPSPDTLIVVCGPDAFVEAVAGGKKGADGKWYGPLGGLLKDLEYASDMVLRL